VEDRYPQPIGWMDRGRLPTPRTNPTHLPLFSRVGVRLLHPRRPCQLCSVLGHVAGAAHLQYAARRRDGAVCAAGAALALRNREK